MKATKSGTQNAAKWNQRVAACLGVIWLVVANSLASAGQVPNLKLVRTIPHSGYSEGLDYHEGYLWHAVPKKLFKIDPKDGSILKTFKPATEYSESLVWFKGALFNVSFSDNGLYRGTLGQAGFDFKRVGTVPEKHAWGLTHDGRHLIVTGNYSQKLYFLNPKDGTVDRVLQTKRKDLEDLAWDGRGIWTSSFTELKGQIFRIDPKTGKDSGPYRLGDGEECPVIDGIAWDGKHLWITGKHCTNIYCVENPLKP